MSHYGPLRAPATTWRRDAPTMTRQSGGGGTSTTYKYKLNLATVDSPAVPFSVVTAMRPNHRRQGSASNGARRVVTRRSDDENEGVDRDATERAQVSSAGLASPEGVRRSTAGTNSSYYKRPDLDMPRADW